MREAEHAMFQIITVAAFFVALAAPVNAQTRQRLVGGAVRSTNSCTESSLYSGITMKF
jgi:hypothetical protein